VVPTANLVKFGQIWQLKKIKLSGSVACSLLLLITLNKNPTVWLAPSSQTVGDLYLEWAHEWQKRTDLTLPRWFKFFCLNHLGSINLNFLQLLLSKLPDVFENLPNFTKFVVGTTLLKEHPGTFCKEIYNPRPDKCSEICSI